MTPHMLVQADLMLVVSGLELQQVVFLDTCLDLETALVTKQAIPGLMVLLGEQDLACLEEPPVVVPPLDPALAQELHQVGFSLYTNKSFIA